MSRRTQILGLLGAALAGVVVAAEPRMTSRVAFRSLPSPSARACIGVLGAVARPGAFEFDRGPVELRDVIAQAGGTTPEATGNIRIIRGGRPGQQVFLHPGTSYLVMPGDVVVAVGRPKRPIPPPRPSDRSPGASEPLPPVEIAFVDVLDRPIVLKVRGEHASVAKLIELLGQPAELGTSVRIIPTMGLVGLKGPLTDRSPLPPSTVLVFERRLLDLDSIPPLPPAIPASGTSSVVADSASGPGTILASNQEASGPSMHLGEHPTYGPITAPPSDAPMLVLPMLNEQLPHESPLMAMAAPPTEAGPEPSAAPRSTVPARPRDRAARTEMLPPPNEGARLPVVETLPAPANDSGAPALTRTHPPMRTEPIERSVVGHSEPINGGPERSVVGYSEPIHGGSPADPGARPFPEPGSTMPYNTAQQDPGTSGMYSSHDRRMTTTAPEAATRAASALIAMGKTKDAAAPQPATATAPSIGAELASTDDGYEEDADEASLAEWSLLGGLGIAAGWYTLRRRKSKRKATSVATAAAAPIAMSIAPTVAATASAPRMSRSFDARVDDLTANRLPIDVEASRLPTAVELFGRPRSRRRQRIDAGHPTIVGAPHFAKADTSAERREESPAAASSAGIAAAAASPEQSAAPLAAGHRVDEPHDDRRAPATARPHLADRKADLLERALTAVQEGGHRGTGGPHISAATSAVETASLEGIHQK